jgi:acetyltransferase
VETWTATTVDEAAALAQTMGYPAVLKIHSTHVTHKGDIHGTARAVQSHPP